jgi:hypothetical protein
MPQNLPSWAEPHAPPSRYGPSSRETPDSHSDPYASGRYSPDPSAYSDYRSGKDPYFNPQPLEIQPPPGGDCGECDVSGLVLVIEEDDGSTTTIDCDVDPTQCELICCSFPAPDQCAPALEKCPIPLGPEWVLLLGALLIGIWYQWKPSAPPPAT